MPTKAEFQPFDKSIAGCPDTTSGNHLIEWFDVPSMQWSGNTRPATPAHTRGICFACNERFTKES